MADKLTKSLRLPHPYEKMVLHGLYASFAGKETGMLMEGQSVRMYVPEKLRPIQMTDAQVETTEIDVAEFVADRINGTSFRIRGSLRPWDVESWVWVGRIN